MWTLYESILSLCQEHGIKGGKMCVDLGLSKSLMTDLKSGRKKGITAETAQKIADYFSVSVDRVLNGPETKKALTTEGERSRENTELSDVYFSLAKDLQEAQIDPVDVRNFAEIIKRNMKKLEEDHE